MLNLFYLSITFILIAILDVNFLAQGNINGKNKHILSRKYLLSFHGIISKKIKLKSLNYYLHISENVMYIKSQEF